MNVSSMHTLASKPAPAMILPVDTSMKNIFLSLDEGNTPKNVLKTNASVIANSTSFLLVTLTQRIIFKKINLAVCA